MGRARGECPAHSDLEWYTHRMQDSETHRRVHEHWERHSVQQAVDDRVPRDDSYAARPPCGRAATPSDGFDPVPLLHGSSENTFVFPQFPNQNGALPLPPLAAAEVSCHEWYHRCSKKKQGRDDCRAVGADGKQFLTEFRAWCELEKTWESFSSSFTPLPLSPLELAVRTPPDCP